MSAALCALLEVTSRDPQPYKNVIPSFVSILKQVSSCAPTISANNSREHRGSAPATALPGFHSCISNEPGMLGWLLWPIAQLSERCKFPLCMYAFGISMVQLPAYIGQQLPS